MRILSIAGPSNNSGKTLLSCRILDRFKDQLQVLKVSTIYRDGNCPRNAQSKACACTQLHKDDYRVISDDQVLSQPETDTGLMVQAGGKPVLWGLARPGAHGALWRHLSEQFLAPERPLLTEGGVITRYLPDRRLIFVINPTTRERWKDDTEQLLAAADLVLINPYEAGFLGMTAEAETLLEEIGSRAMLFDVSLPADQWPEPLAELVAGTLG